ncbi:hypothetical protein AVEN_258908-1 [Araneus ventricosus]|uniref:Uncharacterized protein n=1 Tax=Araneus ventricosus TaxID=182803 RepID=A0A4Y2T762_ARAVE|nr:hypothetical protein AVEN_258908-1 [Araneus ventricosus]
MGVPVSFFFSFSDLAQVEKDRPSNHSDTLTWAEINASLCVPSVKKPTSAPPHAPLVIYIYVQVPRRPVCLGSSLPNFHLLIQSCQVAYPGDCQNDLRCLHAAEARLIPLNRIAICDPGYP